MSAPSDPFDPYEHWLGIAPHEHPVDYYRLLGLPRLEADSARIAAAADERMRLVRSFQVGPRGRFTQRLLNELASAKVCLLSPTAKAAYDAGLVGPLVYFPSPPVCPPPPPPLTSPPRRTAIEAEAAEAADDEPLPSPAPWWRPIAAMLAAALLLLATAAGWSIVRARWKSPDGVSAVAPLAEPAEEPRPEPPEPIVQLQEGNGEVNFAPATAVLTGGVQMLDEGTAQRLTDWQGADAAAEWRFRLVQPGFFQIELTYATADADAVPVLEATVGKQTKNCELRATGGLDRLLTDSYTIAIPSSGQHALRLRTRDEREGGGIALQSVRLVPVGGTAPRVTIEP